MDQPHPEVHSVQKNWFSKRNLQKKLNKTCFTEEDGAKKKTDPWFKRALSEAVVMFNLLGAKREPGSAVILLTV